MTCCRRHVIWFLNIFAFLVSLDLTLEWTFPYYELAAGHYGNVGPRMVNKIGDPNTGGQREKKNLRLQINPFCKQRLDLIQKLCRQDCIYGSWKVNWSWKSQRIANKRSWLKGPIWWKKVVITANGPLNELRSIWENGQVDVNKTWKKPNENRFLVLVRTRLPV